MLAKSALIALAAFLAASAQAGPLRLANDASASLDSALHAGLAAHPGYSLDLNALRLVSFAEDEEPVWMTELEKIKAKASGRRFFDITESYDLGMTSLLAPGSAERYTYAAPRNSSKTSKYITGLFSELSTSVMRKHLEHFSSYRNRYYRAQTGAESQQWLFGRIKELAHGHPHVSVREHEHTWGQNSIIARFPSAKAVSAGGSLSKSKDPVVIIGAHLDSTALLPWLPAPGADDDGSGTTSILDAFRVLAAANYTPADASVEFHWYSAEEGGLLGSQAVAKSYEAEGRKVKAMLQMDMTAWVKKGTTESVGVIQDFVDPELTEFITKLVDNYLSIPPIATKCGYACSDHASWSKAGYQSAFSIESTFEDSNHGIHSGSDTIEHPEFSFEHMKEFSKLALAFAGELGGH